MTDVSEVLVVAAKELPSGAVRMDPEHVLYAVIIVIRESDLPCRVTLLHLPRPVGS